MTNNVNPRAVTLDILIDVLEKDRLSHIVIREKLNENMNLDKQQRAFVTRLAEGTIEKCIELDYILDTYSKTKVKKMKPVIRNILRMSVYQAKYMDSVPDSAVCNEAVKLCAKRGFVNLKGFINGVLRSYLRQPDKVEYPQRDKELVRYLSIKYSIPEWIVKMWISEYGEELTEKMLEASENTNELSVRINYTNTNEDEFFGELEKQGINISKIEGIDCACKLTSYDRVEEIDAFKKGKFQVQDISSMMAGIAASPEKNQFCIDVCAAPGGKTVHLADMMRNTGTVIARDVSEAKVKLIDENANRCGFTNIKSEVWDATVMDNSLKGKADIVLADLPCSGLGVIGKKADIKYKTKESDIEELANLQKEILKTVSEYVKPGGVMVFSTCTVNRKENDDNVKWITANLPFELETLEGRLPHEFDKLDISKGYVQFFNGQNGMDGFFISRFRKRKTDE